MSDTRTDDTPATDAEGKAPKIDGDFDPERMTRLVANLRAEVDELKIRNTAIAAERDEFKTAAEKSGTERDDALKKALERAAEAERKLAIKEHNLPDDVVEEFSDYLTGSAEEVAAKAAKLAKRLGLDKPADDADKAGDADEAGDDNGDKAGDEEGAAELPQRPRPDLVPGHGGDAPAPFDPVAIAQSARRR